MRITFGLSLVAAAALAGCSSSEGQIKQRVREQALSSCRSESAARASQLGGLNVDQFCTCLADKLVEGRSVDDLRKMDSDKEGASQAGQQAAMQCLSSQMGAMVPSAAPQGTGASRATGAVAADNAANTADTE